MSLEWIADPNAWVALATLIFLEIILGIDNIIFISILTNKLPEKLRPRARTTGIGLALVFRILMLAGISWIMQFTTPLFSLFDHAVTGRDLILLIGGLFLIGKSTREIHHKIDPDDQQEEASTSPSQQAMVSIIVQIGLLDIVFSFDSILTAIGMAKELSVMVIAVIVSLLVMLAFAGSIARIVERYPTLQMLALSFLILIGVVLIADGLHFHIPKGYIYFSVAFSLLVEFLNIRMRKRKKASTPSA